MSIRNTLPDPAWVEVASDPIQRRAAMLLKMCAGWYSREGSLTALSSALGLGPRALERYTGRQRVPPDVAIRLENLLGRNVIRREDFRPDHFLPPEDA